MEIKEVKMDKLTLMGNMNKEFESSFQLLLDQTVHSKISGARTSYVTGEFFAQNENSIRFEYDGVLAKSMNRRNFKLEFNPAKINEKQKEFIRSKILWFLSDVGFSRLDIAIDFDEKLSHYQFEIFGRTKSFIHARDGELATFYIGSRQSKNMIRVYDKKRQLLEVEKEEIEDEVLWRLEFELKGHDVIAALMKYGFDSVVDFRIIRYDFSHLSAIDKILCKSYYLMPDDFSDLSKKKKWDIRKKIKESGGEDVSPVIQERIKEKNSLILGELESYLKSSMRVVV